MRLRLSYSGVADSVLGQLGQHKPAELVPIAPDLLAFYSSEDSGELVGFEIEHFSESLEALAPSVLVDLLGSDAVDELRSMHDRLRTTPRRSLEEQMEDSSAAELRRTAGVARPPPAATEARRVARGRLDEDLNLAIFAAALPFYSTWPERGSPILERKELQTWAASVTFDDPRRQRRTVRGDSIADLERGLDKLDRDRRVESAALADAASLASELTVSMGGLLRPTPASPSMADASRPSRRWYETCPRYAPEGLCAQWLIA